jgi:hypothetical protein
MKLVIGVIIMASIICSNTACKQKTGSGKVTTQSRAVNGFNKIKLAGVFKVILRQDNIDAVKVETDDNLQPYVEVMVNNQTLLIRMKENTSITKATKMIVYVSFKNINEIQNKMVGNLVSDGTINADKLTYISTAVGGTNLALAVNNLDMNISAVGNTTLTGKAITCNFVNSAVGNFDGKELLIDNLTIKNTAVGNTYYNALTEKVDNNAVGKMTNVKK